MEVSIIIAAYNAQQWLGRCLESIARQTFADFEAIVVDDCSTDGTLAIAQEQAGRDSRFRVLPTEVNRGVSHSRQRGVDAARGRYIIHVDADDYIDPDMLERLHAAAIAQRADVVICDYIEETPDGPVLKPQAPTSLVPRQVVIDLLAGRLHGSCCNKLVARRLYARQDVKFPPGVNCCEDLYISLMIMLQSPSVAYLPRAFYHYVRVPQASTTTRAALPESLEQDRKLFDMAVPHFAHDPQLHRMAQQCFGTLAVLRAFYSHCLTASQFRQHYARFSPWVKEKFPTRQLFKISCQGLYPIAYQLNKIYLWLLKLKQSHK